MEIILSNGKERRGPTSEDGATPNQLGGFTLPEMMVAIGVGALLLAAMMAIFITSLRSFATIGNYATMNASSRNALDHMTRQIRSAGTATNCITNCTSTATAAQLTFLKYGATGYMVYQWDSDSRQLTEWATDTTTTNVLLTECDSLSFSLYDSFFTPTTDLVKAKAISVSWSCSRTILGKKTTTEAIQQALIVLRNKPTS